MILFSNPGEIDVNAIKTMGASVKEESAIGFFGTGLKYAIGVLLRNNQQITIWSGKTELRFTTQILNVRGREFDSVCMNGEPMNFTTELGKTWEMWMAYRELYCNAVDEGGSVEEIGETEAPYQMFGVEGQTRIYVQGNAIKTEHNNRHSNFIIGRKPIAVVEGVEIYEGETTHFFYKGVRVYGLGRKSVYTYNQTNNIQLNEDRTVKLWWDVQSAVEKAVMNCDDPVMVRRIVTANSLYYENSITLSGSGKYSEAFARVVTEEYRRDMACLNNSLHKFVHRLNPSEIYSSLEAPLSKIQQKQLDKSIEFIQRLGFDTKPYKLRVVETLGASVMAQALLEHKEIIVSKSCFDKGTKFLASTLLEEVIHLRENLKDETRALQMYLFDKIITLGEELIGEPI